MKFSIGVDVGGTFTDFLLAGDDGSWEVYKVLSTPDDPSVAVFEGLAEMARDRGLDLREFLKQVGIIVHGTTVTTNAVITGKVGKTGLLTTKGFRDALQMRRGVREELYNNKYRPPKPIVPRYLRLPVDERVDVTGKVLKHIDPSDVRAALETLSREAVEAVAICFMHSYANSLNELKAEKIVREYMPEAYISVSAKVLPQVRFYERVSTTVLNAAVGPILSKYLRALTAKLQEYSFEGVLLIMQSNGGVMSAERAVDLPAATLLSGPAAAPVAGLMYTSVHGLEDFITIDMGGTSFDACLIRRKRPVVTTEGTVNRYAIALPMIEINTIGAGGGSIAWIDEGGLLRMGPQSAGAKPGPACYGLGGSDPTCTDADLVLGYLNCDYFAGGKIRLDYQKAKRAIEQKIARPLGLSVQEAAHGMFQIMNVNMASGVREITVQKGYDPREFPLICGGGAGPVHAAMIARELEIDTILIPRESSIFCAAGMLLSDLRHDFVRSYHCVLSPEKVDKNRLLSLLAEMEGEAKQTLLSEFVPDERQVLRYSLDLRYVGQYHEVNVAVERNELLNLDIHSIKDKFHSEHERLYGYSLKDEDKEVELVNLRLSAVGITKKPEFKGSPYKGRDCSHCLKEKRLAFEPSTGDFVEMPVYDGTGMGYGNYVKGPALIELPNTTIFVPAGFDVECDQLGTFVLRSR